MPERKIEELLMVDASQLKCMTSPVRAEILSSLVALGDLSVRELGRQLGRDPNGLYYHIRLLMKAGLIVEVGKYEGEAREEMIIGRVAKRIQAPAEGSDIYYAYLKKTAQTYLRQSIRETNRFIDSTKNNSKHFELGDLQRRSFRLPPEKVVELKQRLLQVLKWAEKQSDPELGMRVSLIYTLVPLTDADEVEQSSISTSSERQKPKKG